LQVALLLENGAKRGGRAGRAGGFAHFKPTLHSTIQSGRSERARVPDGALQLRPPRIGAARQGVAATAPKRLAVCIGD